MLVVWLNYNDIDLLNKFQIGSNDRGLWNQKLKSAIMTKTYQINFKVDCNDIDLLDKS